MVCLCGRNIWDRMSDLLDTPSNTITFDNWRRIPADKLYDDITAYNTFKSMIASLLKPRADEAVRFLRYHFAGYLDVVEVTPDETHLADFLTTEGVLLKLSTSERKYCMASAFVDGLIRNRVIPKKFSSAPSVPVPYQESGQMVHVLNILVESLKFFDKDLIRLASERSYKTTKVPVHDFPRKRVPRESVYDTELMRILTNWLAYQYGWTVTGQWHLLTQDRRNKYSDITLKKEDESVALELLATGDRSFLQSHIEKTPEYKALHSTDQTWVVHFTCEQDYNPIWQSEEQLRNGLNVAHFSHNNAFDNVKVRARWRDDTGIQRDCEMQLDL
jgi:hypothetical protein